VTGGVFRLPQERAALCGAALGAVILLLFKIQTKFNNGVAKASATGL
jgi:hypothetical protein